MNPPPKKKQTKNTKIKNLVDKGLNIFKIVQRVIILINDGERVNCKYKATRKQFLLWWFWINFMLGRRGMFWYKSKSNINSFGGQVQSYS